MTGDNIIEGPFWIIEDRGLYGFRIGQSLLAGMPFPPMRFGVAIREIWSELSAAGFTDVVCLTNNRFPYDPAPLGGLHSIHMQDMLHDSSPRDATAEQQKLCAAVDAIVDAIGGPGAGSGAEPDELPAGRRRSVVIHCMGGTGRTGTVLAATLLRLGLSASEARARMREVNALRNRLRTGSGGWPEAVWQREAIEGC